MTSTPLIFGFSGKIASGKSTTAKKLANTLSHDFNQPAAVISFADALREEVSHVITAVEAVKATGGSARDIHRELHNNSPLRDVYKHDCAIAWEAVKNKNRNIRRILMQTWATDVRRASDKNYWVSRAMEKVKELHNDGVHVIFDDVRFENEADEIIKNRGYLFRLNVSHAEQLRRLEDVRGKKVDFSTLEHVSETSLDNFRFFSEVFDNDDPRDTVIPLLAHVSRALEQNDRPRIGELYGV